MSNLVDEILDPDVLKRFYDAVPKARQEMKLIGDIVRKFGSLERALEAVPEEQVMKFYYCESRDQYLVGKRADNFYYAEITPTGDLAYHMSRYLPWGEHVVRPETAWKEHTYPSKPIELHFTDWLRGLMKQQGWEWKKEEKDA